MTGSCEHGNDPSGSIKYRVTISFFRRALLHGIEDRTFNNYEMNIHIIYITAFFFKYCLQLLSYTVTCS
jgi:hypothetical protein